VCDFDGAILATFGEIGRRAGKGYCYPSQSTILSLVGRFYGVRRSRRTLNRHLSALESAGYFGRLRRHKRGPAGELVLRSTLYVFKGKFYNYMGRGYRRAAAFFGVFRVPFLAHNQSSTDRYLSSDTSLSVNKPVDSSSKGGPSGTFSTPLKISP